MCEREVSDMVLREEGEGIPFLFRSCMRITLVSEQKSFACSAICTPSSSKNEVLPKTWVEVSILQTFWSIIFANLEGNTGPDHTVGVICLVGSLKRCGAEREFAIQQGSTDWGAFRVASAFPLLRFIFSSMNQASNSAGRWTWTVPYLTASDMYSHGVGGRLQRRT